MTTSLEHETEAKMGKDVIGESTDQIKFGTRPIKSVERFMSLKACILLGCLTDNAAEYLSRNSTVSITLPQFMSPSHPS